MHSLLYIEAYDEVSITRSTIDYSNHKKMLTPDTTKPTRPD